MKQLTILALAALMLGGCWENAGNRPPPPPDKHGRPGPVVVEQPYEWLSPEPWCRGSLRRAEWLVCDNKNLRYLHKTLAEQWAAKRQGADRRVLRLIRRQQDALISERNLCEDAACVSAAYRRYLAGYAGPAPQPSWTPRPVRPVKSHRPHRPRWQNDSGWQGGYGPPNRRRGEQSCAAEVGGSASAYLVQQCRTVNGRWERGCTADATCADLRERIGNGCSESDRRPGFCDRR